jgi:hypothetical protein
MDKLLVVNEEEFDQLKTALYGCLDLMNTMTSVTIPETRPARGPYKKREISPMIREQMQLIEGIIVLSPGVTRAQLLRYQAIIDSGLSNPRVTDRLIGLEREGSIKIIRETCQTWRLYPFNHGHIPPKSCTHMAQDVMRANKAFSMYGIVNSPSLVEFYTKTDIVEAVKMLTRNGMVTMDYPKIGDLFITERGEKVYAPTERKPRCPM